MIEEIKKELGREYLEICKYTDDCENKQQILKANTNDSKISKLGFISLISMIPTLIASGNLIAPIMSGLVLPITTVMSVAVAASLAIGYVGQKIITSVSKKKMRGFTNAKTNAEILEEMMQYEIEIDKSENRKEILIKMYKIIQSKEKILRDYSDEFCHINKWENLTIEKLQKRKEMLTEAYKDRIEQLNILTSQKYLKNKFQSYRNKKNRIENIITSAFILGIVFSFLIGMPLSLEINKYANLEIFADAARELGMTFIPTLVVFPLAIPYFVKRNKEIMNAFNNLNHTLGENALSENPNVKYEQELGDMIATKIFEIVELGMNLKEINYVIEKRNSEHLIETKKKTYDDSQYTEDKNNLYRQEADLKTIFGIENEEQEQIQEKQDGPRLVKKLSHPKK